MSANNPGSKPPNRPQPPISPLLDALLDGDRARTEDLLEDYLAVTGSYTRLVDELVEPAMEEIGRLWAENEITVSDEHLATAIMQTVLARTFGSAPAQDPRDRKALLACVEGNRHALGLQSLADAFDLMGWETRHLGADVPSNDLIDEVTDWTPDVVCLSVSLDAHLETARTVIRAIRDALGEQAPTILLGGPLDPDAATPSRLQADGWAATAGEALEAVA